MGRADEAEWDDALVAEAIRLYRDEKLSLEAVGERLGRGPTPLTRVLREAGVRIRHPHELEHRPGPYRKRRKGEACSLCEILLTPETLSSREGMCRYCLAEAAATARRRDTTVETVLCGWLRRKQAREDAMRDRLVRSAQEMRAKKEATDAHG